MKRSAGRGRTREGPSGVPPEAPGWGAWAVPLGVLLGVVLVHLALLAWVRMPAPHSGGDNAAYLALAASLVQGTGYTEFWDPLVPPHAKYPPAWSLLLALAMSLGAESWVAFKTLAAALVLLASVGVVVWVAGRWGEARGGAQTPPSPAAWFAGGILALLTLTSAGWVEASRWVLSEPLFLVGVLLALVGADRAGLFLSRRPGWQEPAPWAQGGSLWIGVAASGALLALFTRTAGLPLWVGLLVLLAWGARWRALGAVALLSALPILLWVLRGREAGEGAYQDEFWMVNPYDPALGTVGVSELLARVGTNLHLYLTRVLGTEWWGSVAPPSGVAFLGVSLAALALVGWGLRLVEGRGGLGELFLPLYGGLVLLWPAVWSGDRFVLPLYPLLLFWAAEVLARGWRLLPAQRGPTAAAPTGAGRGRTSAPHAGRGAGEASPPRGYAGWGAAALGSLLLLGPAFLGIQVRGEAASHCRSLTEQAGGDPFTCHGEPFRTFRDAAAWSGVNLPEGAVVLNRKPRIFFALGGTPGRVFPFEPHARPLLAQADALGARYLLIDQVDGVSMRLLPAIVGSWPAAFCWLRDWEEITALLGILPPEARGAPVEEGGEEMLASCDEAEGWLRGPEEARPPAWDATVPVVSRRPDRPLR